MTRRTIAAAAVLLVAALCGSADASVVINIDQLGPNVVATGSGSLNVTDLTSPGTNLHVLGIGPIHGYVGMGSPGLVFVEGFEGLTGPSNFGLGGLTNATSGSGDHFAINGSGFATPPTLRPPWIRLGHPVVSHRQLYRRDHQQPRISTRYVHMDLGHRPQCRSPHGQHHPRAFLARAGRCCHAGQAGRVGSQPAELSGTMASPPMSLGWRPKT
jgi:hypothetical protein